MLKRIFSMLLIAATLLSMLASCDVSLLNGWKSGSHSESKSESKSESESETSPEQTDESVLTLTDGERDELLVLKKSLS